MEKLRVFLEHFKKYHFWVLCGLIVLISASVWFFATGAVADSFDKEKKKIDTAINTAKAISSKPEHPSEAYIKEIGTITSNSLQKQVDGAEGRLYSEQWASNPLPVVFPTEIQKAFEAAFQKNWLSIQEMVNLPANALDDLYRTRYRDHVTAAVFPKLFELIERRTEVVPNPAAANNNPNQAREMTGIVDWEGADGKIKTFQSRFSAGVPSTLDVMMAQEELWVYEALLKVIRYTNNTGPDRTQYPKPANEKEGQGNSTAILAWLEKNYKKPTSHKMAAIKQILEMDIGRDAVQDWKSCERALINIPDAVAAPTAGVSAGNPAAAALAGRYVDDKGHPLEDATQQPFPEFRMMPINLKVVIEQKEIPRLLAECANSAMRIDIRGVRILVEDPPAVELNGADAPAPTAVQAPAPGPMQGPLPTMKGPRERPGRGQFGGGVGRGFGSVGPAGGSLGASTNTGTKGEFAYTEELADPIHPPVPVELQGIIYIYNPVKSSNAGDKSGTTAAPTANGATPVTPNAATPTGGVSTAPNPAGSNPATAKAANPALSAPSGTVPAGPAPVNGAPAKAAPGTQTIPPIKTPSK
jgi:hypothetical protein